jgi:phospholipid-binding lipoprotein MlaA
LRLIKLHKKSHYSSVKLNFMGFLLAVIFLLGGCVTSTEITRRQTTTNPVDPYENVNRKIYIFNDAVDDYIAKPISDAYKTIMPQFAQTGVSNFFNNLQAINVVLNDLLQAKFSQGTYDTGRFLMNTTLGMAGFFDVAQTVGLEQNDEDFEQTLAVWGIPQGSYLVIPFVGPITVRGIPGALVDTAASPVTYMGAPLLSNFIGRPIQGLSLISRRANAEGALKFIDEAALDPYAFTRESFLQWRAHLANDGKTEPSTDLIDIDDQIEKDN